MEGREDEVHQLVCEFLMKDVSNILQNQTKPKHRNSVKGARELKRLQSLINYDRDGSKGVKLIVL